MTIGNNIKALVLLSGGMDSMLAVKVLQAQNIAVDGICFASNFFQADKAERAAKNIGVELRVIDITEELLAIVKNPPSGYGKNMNPCVDCHALMIRKAAEYLKSGDYDFLATGEVLGQRPFSQNKDALARVMRLAGAEVLRPLSAKLLPETEIEKQGLANRGRLLDISGRTRDRQMELAAKYRLTEFSTPAGGCLLTDPEFSQRLNILMGNWPDFTGDDVELIKNGRVSWFSLKNNKKIDKVMAVISRNQEECENLEKITQAGDIIIKLKEINGPTGQLRIKNEKFRIKDEILDLNIPEKLNLNELKLTEEKSEDEIINAAALLTGYYADEKREEDGFNYQFSINQLNNQDINVQAITTKKMAVKF